MFGDIQVVLVVLPLEVQVGPVNLWSQYHPETQSWWNTCLHLIWWEDFIQMRSALGWHLCPTFGPGSPIPSRPGSPGRPGRPGSPCKQITHTATTKHDFMLNYENFITEWCHDHAWFLIRALFYSLRARDSHPLLVHLDPEDLGHHDHPEKQSKSNPAMFDQDWQ